MQERSTDVWLICQYGSWLHYFEVSLYDCRTPEGWSRKVTAWMRRPEALTVTTLQLVLSSVQACISRRPLLQLWLTDEMTSLKPADGCLAPGVILSLLFLVSVPVSLLNWPLACLLLSPSVKKFDRKGNLTPWQRGQRWRRESEESWEVASCCSICFESDEPRSFYLLSSRQL